MRRAKPHLTGLVGLAMLAGAAVPASAQWYGGSYPYNSPPPPYGYGYGYGRILPPDVVVDRIEGQGYDDVSPARFDGQYYHLTAAGRGGLRLRLVVDPYGGAVLRRIAIGGPGPGPAPFFGGQPSGRLVGRGAGPSPYDEMPEAEFRRPRQDDGPRRPAPRREAARPDPGPPADLSPAPLVPAPSGELARPADPRLAPGAAAPVGPVPDDPPSPGAGEAPPRPAVRREAARPPASPRPDGAPSGLYGTNPDRAAAQPTAPATRVQKPAAAPLPATTATATPPAAAAPDETAPRRPVRVIQGVTPMNGGQQTTPAPQNGIQAAPQ